MQWGWWCGRDAQELICGNNKHHFQQLVQWSWPVAAASAQSCNMGTLRTVTSYKTDSQWIRIKVVKCHRHWRDGAIYISQMFKLSLPEAQKRGFGSVTFQTPQVPRNQSRRMIQISQNRHFSSVVSFCIVTIKICGKSRPNSFLWREDFWEWDVSDVDLISWFCSFLKHC